MDPTLEDKLAVASALILQAPPGEVNDVFNDVRPIVGDDSVAETGLLPALAQYNTEQLTLVELPNAELPAMICLAAQLDPSSTENRYLDPHSSQTFTFDHLRLCATDVATFTPENDAIEKTRSELNREAEQYVKDHFQGGAWSVFSGRSGSQSVFKKETQGKQLDPGSADDPTSTGDEQMKLASEVGNVPSTEEADGVPKTDELLKSQDGAHLAEDGKVADGTSPTAFHLYIVGNKYNPSNYWTGRWRSVYEIDVLSAKIQGDIHVNVHYYEQGNVQLTTHHTPLIELDSSTAGVAEIMKAIEKVESAYQNALNQAYIDMGENTFKLLRRALPVTKQKVNWNNMKSRIVLNDN